MDAKPNPSPATTALAPAPQGEAPFTLVEPLHRSAGLVFASPHSGNRYPQGFLAQTQASLASLRRAEDAYVDELFSASAAHGAPLLCATMARAYVDVNRAPTELDPDMFAGPLPVGAAAHSPRVQAGLGAIPRLAGDGAEIYRRRIPAEEAERRLASVHRPYHAMLQALVAETQSQFGWAVLVDCHSMPSCARGPHGPDVVLGDRFGAACHPAVTALAETTLRRMGYRVTRNAPFAGGHTTQAYGRPREGRHAIQIEINRALYLNERTLARSGGFDRVRADITRLVATLCAADWTGLARRD